MVLLSTCSRLRAQGEFEQVVPNDVYERELRDSGNMFEGDSAYQSKAPAEEIASPDAMSYPETWPVEPQVMPPDFWRNEFRQVPEVMPREYPWGEIPQYHDPDESHHDSNWFCPKPHWLGLRHSSTHGRHVGKGQPYKGTSWINRPYYVGGQLGPMWYTRSLGDNLSTDTDVFGGVFAGWDFDHFWGTEFHWDWATPEFINSAAPDANRTDSHDGWNLSLLYYPWGDSKIRPYWRAGIGQSHFDYPTDWGWRYDTWMWTFPLGVGIKYPMQRWLIVRADLTDYISLDDNHPTQHNVAVTFGFEWRFGVQPKSYWPWNPEREIW